MNRPASHPTDAPKRTKTAPAPVSKEVAAAEVNREFDSFDEFYPVYLANHQNPNCRAMHAIGCGLAVAAVATFVATRRWQALAAAPVLGYGFAWMGHMVFERNNPTFFKHPFYSFLGDWTMAAETVEGKLQK